MALALSGDLRASVNAACDGLVLARRDGSNALAYTGLSASNAAGKTLPASLEGADHRAQQNADPSRNYRGSRGHHH